jgi:uncharacterized repeat protein (TIGR03803 family)
MKPLHPTTVAASRQSAANLWKLKNAAFCRKPPRLFCILRGFAMAVVLQMGMLAGSAQTGVVFTSLYSFTGGTNGANPVAGLVQGSDGNFYGTTTSGSPQQYTENGTVFKISPNGVLTTLYAFDDSIPYYGANPAATLVQGSDGNFYGTTTYGGTASGVYVPGPGTVFNITTNGVLTSLYSFYGGFNSANPQAGLVQGSDGNFYGTTRNGGGYGTVFNITTNGTLTNLYSFTGTNDGANPSAGLVQGSDGNFYGTTAYGGTNGLGTVFKISTNDALASLYSFTGTNDGAHPQAGLVQGSDGNFYGTTAYGGTNGAGTVFRISTNGELASLYSFTGTNDGEYPIGGLVQGSDGNFYGTTESGGAHTNQYGQGLGTVFKISANGAFTSLYSFSGTNDGANPEAALVQGSDGNFYGTTEAGGTNNLGTVFRLTILPVFQAVTLTNGARILTWSVEAGGTYQLQYRRDWTSVNWNNLGSTVFATGATLSFTDYSLIDPWRVYRVRLLP